MPCRIEILKRIENIADEQTKAGLAMSLADAEKLATNINNALGAKIVMFAMEGDYLSRDIQVPASLVDEYYENEKGKEEAEDLQRRREGHWTEDDEGNIIPFYHKGELPASRASKQTLSKVKEVIEKMGVSVQALSDYLKGNPAISVKGTEGLSDMVKGVIAVAQGKEDVVLTEEMVHIATAMIEQTNPKLITQLISKIDRFRIYKLTLEVYKKDKNYQLSDDKPDIRKIKKEAVDKLITELIINQSEGSTEFPELMKEEERSFIKRMWETILDAIRGMYKKSDVDIFEQVAEKVIEGDFEYKEQIEGIYLQKNKKDEFSYNSRITKQNFSEKSIPESFKILFSETVDKTSIGIDKHANRFMESFLHSPLYKKFNGKSFKELSEEGIDLEGREIQQYLSFRIIKSLFSNTFNRELAIKLGVGDIWFANSRNIPPIFGKGKEKRIIINLNKYEGIIHHILLSTEKGVEEDAFIDTFISEELIHIVSTNVSSETDVSNAYKELSNEDKLKILQTYYHDTTITDVDKLSNRAYVHEYVRMQVQKKVLGYTTEEKRTHLKKIIDGVWNYLQNLIYEYTSLRRVYDQTLNFIESPGERLSEMTYDNEPIGLPKLKNLNVDKVYNSIMGKAGRMQLFPETSTDKRHYTFDGKRVAKSVTEKIKEESANKFKERTPEQKFFDDQKQQWGTNLHLFLERYISTNLIDKQGYKRDVFGEEKITTLLSDKVREKVEGFTKELVSSYPEGTRFILETMVVNERFKGMLASTVDFMAITPVVNKKGENDVKVDILDWKAIGLDKNKDDDVPWFKRKEWKEQMGHYSQMMQNYGIKSEQLRKMRMIPFILNYEYRVPRDRKSGLVPKSLEVGKVDSLTETTLYLLPVALNTETTGNKRIDALVGALTSQWEKLYSKPVSPEERFKKNETLNAMSAAIRHLQIALNFSPLVKVGLTFLNNAIVTIKSFKNIDYSKFSEEEIEKKLGDLISYRESAEKFTELDEVFLSQYPIEGLDKDDLKVLGALSNIAKSAERMLDEIEDIQRKYVMQLALKRGIVLEEVETEKGIKIKAEAVVNNMLKTFEQASHLAPKLIQVATNIITNSINLVNNTYRIKMKQYEKLLIPLEQEASAKGKRAFDLIGRVHPEGLKLFKKLDKNFWMSLSKAREEGNKKFLMENMDIEKFNVLAKKAIDSGIEDLNNTVFSEDEKEDTKKREAAIKRLKDAIDINRDSFTGYEGFQFGYIFNQVIKEEGHYSAEYAGMSDNARNMWAFYTELNQKAKQLGYLDKEGSSFFPLIEATTLQKFYQSRDVGKQIKEFFTDMYTVKVNEENAFAKFNPETGKPNKQLQKYFTRMDRTKTADQMSTDLGRVGALWIKSILDYEAAKANENTLNTILDIEKTKGNLILNPTTGEVILEGGIPKVDYSENKNAKLLQAMLDDHLYNLREDLSSLGNIGLSKITGKLAKTEEEKEKKELSIRKGIQSIDTWVRIMGVGLKPLIGFANYMGYQFQSLIQAGNFYRFREFEYNNGRITTGMGISTIERALLDMIIPFNEDVAEQLHRKIARKQGFLEYINTWKFVDTMMITNRFPERKLQYANALSFLDNSMVVDGKIVNIRQYVKRQDAKLKYEKDASGNYVMSQVGRRNLEKTYEARVDKLKQSSSLKKVAKIVDDEVVIEGVDAKAIAEFRTQIVTYSGTLNGQMTEGDKAGFRRDTIVTSFMMFKTWIPPLVSARTAGLHKNIQTDEWTYGRTRVFVKTWAELGMRNIAQMKDIIYGTDKGLEILDRMLEAKKAEHYRKTGQELEITQEEFNDLIRQELSREMKELGCLFSVMALVIGAKAAQPPEDASEFEKNRYKWWARAVNKMSQEITFYYDPLSLDGVTRGSIMPSIGLLTRAGQLITNLRREATGYIIDDEEMINKAHPIKYFLNIIPVGAQFQNEVLPYISPETAKAMGIRVTTESRGR